jgi:Putative zinc-finger
MDCQQFLEGYSAYRDHDVTWAEREAFEAHMDECEACARYDRVVRRGVDVFGHLPELEVSDDFGARLQHRIWHEDAVRTSAARRASAGAGAATVGLAAMIAAAAWVPLMQPPARLLELPAVAVRAPASGLSPASSPLHTEATRLTSHLAEMGVQVVEMPYHDVVFRPRGPLVGQLAVMSAPVAASPGTWAAQ